MVSEAIRAKGLSILQRSLITRVLVYNLGAGLPVLLAVAMLDSSQATSFGFGFFLGLGNMLWLLRIAKKGVHMPPRRAGRYVALNYMIRFSLMMFVLIAVVTKGIFIPVPLMAGIAVPVATTIVLTVKTAKELSV